MTTAQHIPRHAVRIEKRLRLRLLLNQAQTVVAELAAVRTEVDRLEVSR